MEVGVVLNVRTRLELASRGRDALVASVINNST